MERKRVDWIDIEKGIAILLVIVGHTITTGYKGSITRGIIFSFHMPLFFILSGVTYKCSSSMEEYKKRVVRSAKHLLGPLVITFFEIIVYQCLHDSSGIGLLSIPNYWIGKIYMLIMCTGSPVRILGRDIEGIGAAWFFIAFFFGRIAFDYLHLVFRKEQLIVACVLVTIAGVLLGQKQPLPFSLDIAMSVMIFFYLGYRTKNIDLELYFGKRLIISLLVWIGILWITFPNYQKATYLELATRRYPLFPISYIGAVAGIVFWAEISFIISKIPFVKMPFIYIGRNTLYLLLIHIFDYFWFDIWNVPSCQFLSAIYKVISDLCVLVVFLIIKNIIIRCQRRI